MDGSLSLEDMSKDDPVLKKLNLLENALDFTLKGIDELFDDEYEFKPVEPTSRSIRSYKYGILHLFGGFLLLLKERLARHVPELIYTGTIQAAQEKLRNGKVPNTVDLDEALDRLASGPRIAFSDRDIKCIRFMQGLRNAFEHFEVSVNPYQVWSEISNFLKVVDDFLVEHLDIQLEDSMEGKELYGKTQKIEQVWHRVQRKRADQWLLELQAKLQEFLKNREVIIRSLERDYIASKGAEDPFIDCPECYKKSLTCFGEYEGICTSCNNFFYLTSCDGCGQIIPQESLWRYYERIRQYGILWCDSCESRIAQE